MKNKENDFEEKLVKTANSLIQQGFPPRMSVYAASMGYLKNLKKK